MHRSTRCAKPATADPRNAESAAAVRRYSDVVRLPLAQAFDGVEGDGLRFVRVRVGAQRWAAERQGLAQVIRLDRHESHVVVQQDECRARRMRAGRGVLPPAHDPGQFVLPRRDLGRGLELDDFDLPAGVDNRGHVGPGDHLLMRHRVQFAGQRVQRHRQRVRPVLRVARVRG